MCTSIECAIILGLIFLLKKRFCSVVLTFVRAETNIPQIKDSRNVYIYMYIHTVYKYKNMVNILDATLY